MDRERRFLPALVDPAGNVNVNLFCLLLIPSDPLAGEAAPKTSLLTKSRANAYTPGRATGRFAENCTCLANHNSHQTGN